MGEALDLFVETIVVQRLDGLDHPRMERAPPLPAGARYNSPHA